MSASLRVRPLQASIAAALALFLASAFSQSAVAAAYVWDGNLATGGAQDGGGTWNVADANWDLDGSNVPWADQNDANFGAGVDGSYAVIVALDPVANSLNFNNSGYVLSAGSSRLITVSNPTAALTVAAGKTATIGAGVTVVTPTINQTTIFGGSGTLVIESGGAVKNNGTLNSNRIDFNGIAVEVRTGGNILTSPVAGGGNGNAIFINGPMTVAGGTVSSVGTIGIGQSNAAGAVEGTLTIQSGTVLATSTNGIRFGAAAGSTPGGTLNLDGGTLTANIIFQGSAGVASSVVNFNGGTLRANASSATFLQGLTRANVRDGGAVIDSDGRIITIGQALEHSNLVGDSATDGGLTKLGTGSLFLTGANTYTGPTLIEAGTLQFGAGALPPGSSQITINSAGALVGGGALPGVPEWLASGRIAPSSTGSIALEFDSSDNIDFASHPNLMLGASANASYSGTLLPAASTYRLGGGGGTLVLSNANTLTGSSNLVVGATGSTGTIILAADNNYTGTTTINSGTLQFQGAAIPTGLTTIASTGVLAVPSVAAWLDTGNVAPSSSGVIAQAGDSAENIDFTAHPNLILGAFPSSNYSGVITPGGNTYRLGGGGALTLISPDALTGANNVVIGTAGVAGTVIIANSNDYTGSTTINSGTLQLGNGAFDGSISSSSGIVNNSTLAFNPSSLQTFSQSVSGTGSLVKLGVGTLILDGNSTYTGLTQLNEGILQVASVGALGGSTLTGISGTAQLQLSGDVTVTNPIQLQGAGLNGDGVLKNVAGSNTLTDFRLGVGGTRVNVAAGSTLILPNSIGFAPNGAVQNFRVIGTGTILLGGNNSAAIGAANLFLLGAGFDLGPTVRIGHNSAFGAGTIDFQPTSSPTLLSSDSTARTITNPLAFNDFALNSVTFGSVGTGDLTFSGDATLMGNLEMSVLNASTTLSGRLTGFASVTKSGPGTLVLGGAVQNDYSGGTLVNGGILVVQKDGGLGLGDASVAAGATLRLELGTSNNYISDSGRLLLASGSAAVNLAFSGIPDLIAGLSFDGGQTFAPAGIWGSPTSGAQFTSPVFTGTGTLQVVPEPGILGLLSLGALVGLMPRPRRR
jgi:fibronectin-binding autotransporter adhesin